MQIFSLESNNFMGKLYYITTKLRTDYCNNQSYAYIMYIAKLETKTNLYLDTTAKLVPEKFSIETKSSSISLRF